MEPLTSDVNFTPTSTAEGSPESEMIGCAVELHSEFGATAAAVAAAVVAALLVMAAAVTISGLLPDVADDAGDAGEVVGGRTWRVAAPVKDRELIAALLIKDTLAVEDPAVFGA
jgi:hypothetical protein